MTKTEVFISYAWGGESEEIANKVDAAFLQNRISIIRDKRNLEFKGLITDFMREIGKGKAVITIISDKYLKSPYCMFELLEIFRNSNFSERIFPIVLSDAKIFEPIPRLEYYNYWQNKKKELDKAIKKYGTDAITIIGDDFVIYKRIGDNIGELLNLLRDINSIIPKIDKNDDFNILIEAIRKQITELERFPPPREYNISRIINLINNSFNDTELQQFCMNYYDDVYNTFANGMDKTQKILKLIDYSKRHLLMDSLLDNLANTNQIQFDLNKPYY
jgi:hypothetical protein